MHVLRGEGGEVVNGMRPQWEIDAIDALEDARERRYAAARIEEFRRRHALGPQPKVKKGRGQRRNRRNRR